MGFLIEQEGAGIISVWKLQCTTGIKSSLCQNHAQMASILWRHSGKDVVWSNCDHLSGKKVTMLKNIVYSAAITCVLS